MHLIGGLFDSPAELGIVLFAWLPFALVGGIVGYLIGRSKGRGTEGAWLGAFLGCIGWVITAVLSPKTTGVVPGSANSVLGAHQSAVSPMAAGWHADPFRRFQLRYHDGSGWTDQVATDGRQFTDAPTP